jgi:DNA repair protein RadC
MGRSRSMFPDRQSTLNFSASLPVAAPETEASISSRYRLELVREATVPFSVEEIPTLSRPATVARFLWETLFEQEPREVLVVLFLDIVNRPIGHFIASIGTPDRALMDPRVILAAALLRNAAGIVVAHNHPSGSLKPSPNDRMATRRLQQAADILGIRLYDHLILGEGGRFYSFREDPDPDHRLS